MLVCLGEYIAAIRSSGTSVWRRCGHSVTGLPFGFAAFVTGASTTLAAARFRGLSLAVIFRAVAVTFFAVRAIAPPAFLTTDFPFCGICFSFRNSQWLHEENSARQTPSSTARPPPFQTDTPARRRSPFPLPHPRSIDPRRLR